MSSHEERREVTWIMISGTIKAQEQMLGAVDGLPSYQQTGLHKLVIRLTGSLADLVGWINDPGYAYDDQTVEEIAKEIGKVQNALIYEQLAKTYIPKDELSDTYTHMLMAYYHLQNTINTVTAYLAGTEDK